MSETVVKKAELDTTDHDYSWIVVLSLFRHVLQHKGRPFLVGVNIYQYSKFISFLMKNKIVAKRIFPFLTAIYFFNTFI